MEATDHAPDLLPLLWEAHHALQGMSRQMERTLGVSGPQRLVLREVGRRPDLPPGELAELLGVHPSTITGLVDRLVDRGLMHRVRRADDRRSSHLRLSPTGEALLHQDAPTIESVVESATCEMPLEVRLAAADVLHTLSLALRAAADGAPPP